MTWSGVVDAWMTELTTNVAGLTSVPASCQHKYAPWSVEALTALADERHLAIWPESEPEVSEPLSTGVIGATVMATDSYVVLVWEDASDESSRRVDDDTANAAWLALHEAIRARFLTGANIRLGDSSATDVTYRGCAFDMVGPVRTMAIRFQVRTALTYA